MTDIPIIRDYDSLDTLSEMSEKYKAAYETLVEWENDKTKLNEENMNKLRNAITVLQQADTIVNNSTIKMLWQLLDELVGQRVKNAGYAQAVNVNEYMTDSNVNNGEPLNLTKPGAPEIFNDYEDNQAVSPYSHAEGLSTDAGNNVGVTAREVAQLLSGDTDIDTSMLSGIAAHSEGAHTCAANDFSHAEGLASKAIGFGSHAEGFASFDDTEIKVTAIDGNILTVDYNDHNYIVETLTRGTLIRVKDCHAIVDDVKIDKVAIDQTEGSETIEGGVTATEGVESTQPTIKDVCKVVLRYPINAVIDIDNETGETKEEVYLYVVDISSGNQASGNGSHAEGCFTHAKGDYSHTEGNLTHATSHSAHAEGNGTTASGEHSHAEGASTTASGRAAHAEGIGSIASGDVSHSEGGGTTAQGHGAHAEGYGTEAKGSQSHSEGYNTIAAGDYQHVQGRYNIEDGDGKYAHIVGNGSSNTNRSNAHTVDWEGNGWFAGNVEVPEGKDFNVNGRGLLGALNDEITNREKADDQVRRDLTGTEQDDKDTVTIHGARNYAKNYTDAEIIKLLNNWINAGDQDNIINKVQEIITWFANHSEGSTTLADILNTISNLQTNKLDTENAVGQFERNQETDEILGEKFNDYDNNVAAGQFSHAEGKSTQSNSYASHSEGVGTIASGYAQHVEGQYNEEDKSHTYAHILGNGSAAHRSNAHTVDWEGNAWYRGHVYVGGNSQNSAQRLPVIYSGTSVPDNGLGLDGDLYIMFTETTTEE